MLLFHKIIGERGVPLIAILVLTCVSPAFSQTPPGGPQSAERVMIRFTDGTFDLVSRTSMRKTLPLSDELPAVQSSGFWYELQSADGTVLYRRIIGDPIRMVFEGPDIEDPDAELPDRKESIPQTRIFTLLIPTAPPGAQLVLFSSPLEEGAQTELATEVGRVSFAPIIQ